ncbi:hypothetical protein GCM10011504_05170 [Siccirubricoccus deserti]|nr:hypothetical protein [Siccirubricoccus deserti]GGC29902.1 hypothetical protein GCM10011504_05170 [Siccirubricoccus deserti]
MVGAPGAEPRLRVVFAAEGEPATGERAAERLFDICLRKLGGNPG